MGLPIERPGAGAVEGGEVTAAGPAIAETPARPIAKELFQCIIRAGGKSARLGEPTTIQALPQPKRRLVLQTTADRWSFVFASALSWRMSVKGASPSILSSPLWLEPGTRRKIRSSELPIGKSVLTLGQVCF
jgi:hypothetical protein